MTKRLTRKYIQSRLWLLIYVFVCILGVLITFYPTLLSGFSFMQGSRDTRLNNYFLEHSFQTTFNKNYIGKLWSPTFFYPYKEVLAFSDNLFGSALVPYGVNTHTIFKPSQQSIFRSF